MACGSLGGIASTSFVNKGCAYNHGFCHHSPHYAMPSMVPFKSAYLRLIKGNEGELRGVVQSGWARGEPMIQEQVAINPYRKL